MKESQRRRTGAGHRAPGRSGPADKDLTAEERELAELYTALIEAYGERHYPVRTRLRTSSCARLLEGSRHTSEILSAKRSTCRAQAKKLAEFFNLPAGLFI